MSGVIPPLPQYACMAWCSVKAQGQLYVYLLPFFSTSLSLVWLVGNYNQFYTVQKQFTSTALSLPGKWSMQQVITMLHQCSNRTMVNRNIYP
jgi:hypothetical protein